MLIAEHDDVPVGLAVAEKAGAHVGYLYVLYVRPAARGNGRRGGARARDRVALRGAGRRRARARRARVELEARAPSTSAGASRPCRSISARRSTTLVERLAAASRARRSARPRPDRRRRPPSSAPCTRLCRGSAGPRERSVTGPRNGWVAVHDELLRPRSERSSSASARSCPTSSAASCSRSASRTARVVRYALFDRGGAVDEYVSVPEYFGPLPPGDVVALGANPTVRRAADRRRSRRACGRSSRTAAVARRPAARARARSGRSPTCSASRGRARLAGYAHALRRRALSVLRPRAHRPRGEGRRVRDDRDRPHRPSGVDLREELDRSRARARGGRLAAARSRR